MPAAICRKHDLEQPKQSAACVRMQGYSSSAIVSLASGVQQRTLHEVLIMGIVPWKVVMQ